MDHNAGTRILNAGIPNEGLLSLQRDLFYLKTIKMNKTNQTVSYFIIRGISELPELMLPVFLLVLLLYLSILSGNMTILLLVFGDHRLHTPMYFFLANLSILDISSTAVTLHKILTAFVTGNRTVSFAECMAHAYFFMALQCTILLMLAAMSYDRFLAICNPLHYHMVMSPKLCVLLAFLCWLAGFVEVIHHIYLLSHFTCYTSNYVDHFFCSVLQLIKLSCSDTSLLKLLIDIQSTFISGLLPLLMTVIPYIFIILAILKIHSSTGRHKAFYTCSSHLTVVILLYVTLYLPPTLKDTLGSPKLFSLFNAVAVPLLNPLIYSLKNTEVKSAMKRLFKPLHDSLNQYFNFQQTPKKSGQCVKNASQQIDLSFD
ncbi:olfactory receptor 2AP1-like [Pseudophryne corroboree]|uniref:olfactory receptor 2AP1-like n=1 Tax=Pseudophryne corroboree TaxID=495146 RepID=UPI0030813189